VDYIRDELHYPGLKQAAVLEKTTSKGVHERWYLLTSLGPDKLKPKEFLATIRKHWQIENGLHHVKDTTFQEDAHRSKSTNQGHAMAILRNVIVSVLNKTIPPPKRKMSRPLQAIHFLVKPLSALYMLQHA
jgi:predicted transposase YbfD/YdcC